MVSNTWKIETLGDVNKQIVDVNFVHEGNYRTHNMKLEYNFNNVQLDSSISITS